MKIYAAAAALALLGLLPTFAASSVNSSNRYAYGANVGWVDARADNTNGAVIGEYVCSGYLYGANIGWIHLGDGSPTNQIRYGNTASNDYGVNHDGGVLSGMAYGANVGWINFETNGAPRVDLVTGAFSGYAYGANIGWISLSNAMAYVQTDHVQPGTDSDADCIADAWELTHTNSLLVLTNNADFDLDGVNDDHEYVADTDPFDALSRLELTNSWPDNVSTQVFIVWRSSPARVYRVETNANLVGTNGWSDSGLGVLAPNAGTSTTQGIARVAAESLRIRAGLPLLP